MLPKTFSASAFQTYLNCAMGYKTDYIDRVNSPSGDAANLGTACHGALEDFVAGGHHLTGAAFTKLQALYTKHYYELFASAEMYEDGVQMLENWYERMNWLDREVISTESKETFDIPVRMPDGAIRKIPVTYIMDRLDLTLGGIPDVVDYKSIRENLSPEQLRGKIQARVYGVAAQMKYPDAPGVWVHFDLLRYQSVGVYFTKEDNRQSYTFIQQLAQRIVDDAPDGPPDENGQQWRNGRPWPSESVNVNCKYCTRRAVCATVQKYHDAGGFTGLNLSGKPELLLEVVDKRARLKWAADALKYALEEVDNVLTDYMQEEGDSSLEGTSTFLEVKSRSRNVFDEDKVKATMGPDVWSDYSTMGVQSLRKAIKEDPRLSDDQKSVLKGLITKGPAGLYLKSSDKGVLS